MKCVHGIPMEARCKKCPTSSRAVTKEELLGPQQYSQGPMLPYDPLQEAIDQLSRNIAGLTGVAEKLVEIGERLEPKRPFSDAGVVRGPITDLEIETFFSVYFGVSGFVLPTRTNRPVRACLESFARDRGVL